MYLCGEKGREERENTVQEGRKRRSVFKGGRGKETERGRRRGEREPGGSNGVPKKLAGGLLHTTQALP
jgi:hypothetical protein